MKSLNLVLKPASQINNEKHEEQPSNYSPSILKKPL